MPTLPRMKQAEASCHWPLPTSASAAVLTTPTPRKIPSSAFFAPNESAAAPSSGDSSATATRAMAVALAWRIAAAPGGAPAAA